MRVRKYTNLPYPTLRKPFLNWNDLKAICCAEFVVCAECGGTIDLPAAPLRSDHRRSCLRTAERVEFKVAVLVRKVLHQGQAPNYLGPLTRVADLPDRPALPSTGSNRLCTCHMWDCLLSIAGPSRSPDLKSGTIYLNMWLLLTIYVPSAAD